MKSVSQACGGVLNFHHTCARIEQLRERKSQLVTKLMLLLVPDPFWIDQCSPLIVHLNNYSGNDLVNNGHTCCCSVKVCRKILVISIECIWEAFIIIINIIINY